MMCRAYVSYGMEALSTFQYDILAVLHDEGTVYGLKIKRELESRHPKYDGEVNHGRLYPNLDDLVDAGYVDKSARDQRSNEYTLTDAGQGALRERIMNLGGEL
jgi:DNA-binding PadR family transcriptional regulator